MMGRVAARNRVLMLTGAVALLAGSCGERGAADERPAPAGNGTSQAPPTAVGTAADRSSEARSTPPAPAPETPEELLAGHIVKASPLADPRDRRARDRAGVTLSRIGVLVDMIEENILWGQFNEREGYAPRANRLLALPAEVWARLYLSCFMFEGPAKRRQEGDFTVLEAPARFRSGLDDGEYPHPFWHSEQEWSAYLGASSIMLVFRDEQLVAAYFRSADGPQDPGQEREWDQRWEWEAANGAAQPRVSQFGYLLSTENPELRGLGAAYGELTELLESQDCIRCHTPANVAKSKELMLLGYPNQALAAREALIDVLERNSMPPAEPAKRWQRGIQDEAARLAMLEAAKKFRELGDAALAYEGIKLERPEEYEDR